MLPAVPGLIPNISTDPLSTTLSPGFAKVMVENGE